LIDEGSYFQYPSPEVMAASAACKRKVCAGKTVCSISFKGACNYAESGCAHVPPLKVRADILQQCATLTASE